MAETKLVSLRVPVDLWAWAGVYAKERGTTKTALVESALRELRGLSEGGVPDLEQPHVATVREMQRPAVVEKSEWERTMRTRQDRLNKQKGM